MTFGEFPGFRFRDDPVLVGITIPYRLVFPHMGAGPHLGLVLEYEGDTDLGVAVGSRIGGGQSTQRAVECALGGVILELNDGPVFVAVNGLVMVDATGGSNQSKQTQTSGGPDPF